MPKMRTIAPFVVKGPFSRIRRSPYRPNAESLSRPGRPTGDPVPFDHARETRVRGRTIDSNAPHRKAVRL
jgi:hypothetical protein